MSSYFLQSDPDLNPNFRRFASPPLPTRAPRRWLLTAMLAEAAEHRKHGDTAAAIACEHDAARVAREVAR